MLDMDAVKGAYHIGQEDARLNVDLFLGHADVADLVGEPYVQYYRNGARDYHALAATMSAAGQPP